MANIRTSSTIAVAGLKTLSSAFCFTHVTIFAASRAPGCGWWLWVLRPRKKRRERNALNKGYQLNTAFPRRAYYFEQKITQHKNFYYLYACKTVVFINIYSSIELTLAFDRTDLRLEILCSKHCGGVNRHFSAFVYSHDV